MILSHRIYTSTLIGISGASVMCAMSFGRVEPAMAMIAGAGAFFAGLPVAGLFGGQGRKSALAAGAGAVMATGLGAILAGVVLALGTGFPGAVAVAPAAVFGAILSKPLAALTWACSMAGVHFLTQLARDEAAF